MSQPYVGTPWHGTLSGSSVFAILDDTEPGGSDSP